MNGVMKYRFFKLSIFSLTLYLLAMSVNADLADNKNETSYSSDHRIILSADGSFKSLLKSKQVFISKTP